MALEPLQGLKPLKPLGALKPLGLSGEVDTKTSSGLYSIAKKNGLQSEANDIVKLHSGEETKKFFSGGVISDVFDVLNVASYGVVGTLKGQSFAEGVKNRESFSDEDALGQYGLGGMVAGIALDIVTDPFTYIAPWTALNKIPGFAKGAGAVAEKALGKTEQKIIEDGTGRVINELESLTPIQKATHHVADKVVWMYGQDPIFRETYEKMQRGVGIQTATVSKLLAPFNKIDPAFADKLLTRVAPDVEGGVERFARQDINVLQRELTVDQFKQIKPIWDKIDEMGKELVDLGVLGKGKFEENLGTYVKNVYTEYETAKMGGVFGTAKITGIKGTKARKEGLTQEAATRAGQIENPHYVLGVTMMQMVKDIENAKLFKAVSKNFATDKELEGFVRLADTRRFQTTAGATSELATKIGEVNVQLKPLFKDLRSTFKADKEVMSQINTIEKTIAEAGTKRAEELTKFFSDGNIVEKTTTTARKLGTIPEALSKNANDVKKFDNFDDFMKSPEGIQLEKLYINGDLERNGFSSMEKFFDTVKNPFKPEVAKTGKAVAEGDVEKAISLQRQIEQLTAKSSKLSDIDKRSINDSFRYLESKLAELTDVKTGLKEEIQANKLGDLAGKYIPANMEKYINEVANPSSALGNHIVSEFKYMKVVLSPSTHVRNILSNQILNWWKLGIGPYRQDLYYDAVMDIRKGGEWTKRAEKVGLGADTYAANELKGLLDSPEMSKAMTKYGAKWNEAKKFMGNIYQEEENVAKLVAFKHSVEKGFSDIEAWKMAESATFNYAQVTPFVRKLRTAIWGAPFITFPLKAAPIAVETALKHTPRMSFFGKLKEGMESQGDTEETKRERASELPHMKDGFFVKLPFKDSEGRSAYFDLTYVIPLGIMMGGGISKETGLETGVIGSVASNIPAFGFVRDLTRNRDFSGNKIFRESDSVAKKTADFTAYLMKTMAPPVVADQIPTGYRENGERIPGGVIKSFEASDKNQRLTTMETMLKYVGAKVQPVDASIQESINERNQKRGLQTLLTERGVVKDFSNVYVPK